MERLPVVVATGGELAVAGIPDDAVAESVRSAMPISRDGVLGLGRRSSHDHILRIPMAVRGRRWSRNPRRWTLGRRGRGLGAACWRRRRRRRRRRDCTFQVRVQGAGWSRKPRRLALAQRNVALGALGPACRRLRRLRLRPGPLGSPGFARRALVMQAGHLGDSGGGTGWSEQRPRAGPERLCLARSETEEARPPQQQVTGRPNFQVSSFFFTTLQLFSLSMHCVGCHLIRVLFPVLLHHPLGFQFVKSKQISINYWFSLGIISCQMS